MQINQVIKNAQEEFAALSKLPVNAVIGLSRTDDGWLISLEALERKGIQDTMDLLGIYEVNVDSDCNLLCFERKRLRKRGETQE